MNEFKNNRFGLCRVTSHLYFVLSHSEAYCARARFQVGINVGHGAVADADVGAALCAVDEVL